ncbi:MAG TPA: hypothetical protein VNT33_05520 [Telluria sp.]|nr:hypothetical protein [Telluria sp.]
MHTRLVRTCLCALSLAATAALAQHTSDANVPPATARQQASEIARGDPARWFKEDVSEQERMRTMLKEIGAAYAEAKAACREAPERERGACLKHAEENWKQDLANARTLLDMTPQPSVRPRR